jgi:hypothetical protein
MWSTCRPPPTWWSGSTSFFSLCCVCFAAGGGSCCFVERLKWLETPRTLGIGVISFPLFLPRFPLCRQLKHSLSLSHAAVPIDIDPSSHPPSTIGSFIFSPAHCHRYQYSLPLLCPFLVNLPALVLWRLPFFEELIWLFCYVDSTTVLFFLCLLGNERMIWWRLTATLPPPNVHDTWGRVGTSACLRSDLLLFMMF